MPARLWIAGNAMPGSAYLEVLRQKIRLLDLTDRVSLIGTLRDQQDKIALLRASDAFAAGFIRSEPFGLVLTEAFATELPVVVPATGAAPELMRYVGDTSTLYPANDTGALAARLRGPAPNSPARRASLAQRQRWALPDPLQRHRDGQGDRARVRVGDQGAGRAPPRPQVGERGGKEA